MHILRSSTFAWGGEVDFQIVDALQKNSGVMCAAFPTSIDVSEAQVKVNYTQHILRCVRLVIPIGHLVLPCHICINVGPINGPNAFLGEKGKIMKSIK